MSILVPVLAFAVAIGCGMLFSYRQRNKKS